MPVFDVEVIQTYTVLRKIVVPVEADNIDHAVEQQAQDPAPSFNDLRWSAHWTLITEECCRPANKT